MHKFIFIICCMFPVISDPEQVKYNEVFADEYSDALSYTAQHTNDFKKSAEQYNNDPALLTSIVFPELMRYSLLKDVLETGALELAYIDKGAEGADFSIGRFQMKPSFAEDLENQVSRNDTLKQLYAELITYSSTGAKEIREERLRRLTALKWQLAYLNCFVSTVNARFPSQKFNTPTEKILFYSSAYNGGFHRSSAQIISNQAYTFYPYGTKYKGKQYAYADVSRYFFQRTYRKKN